MNRYALNWSFYLGNHWSYLREPGEPQVTFNYWAAFTDYLNTFMFGKGVDFETPKDTAGIIPSRLQRVWERDNDRRTVLARLGQQGGVSGDAFVKVAYQEPPAEPWKFPPTERRGKVRILVMDSSHVFPDWHPHDENRFLRVKIKYKFWGQAPEGTRQVFTYCVDDKTQALTRRGWKNHWDITTDDEVYAFDPHTREARWEPVQSMNRFDWDGPLTRYKSKKVDALTTPNHRWMVESRDGSKIGWTTTEHLTGAAIKAVHGGGTPTSFSDVEKVSDEFAELVAWVVTEGHYRSKGDGVIVAQSEDHNPDYVYRIRKIADYFRDRGATVSEYRSKDRPGMLHWYFGAGVGADIRSAAPNKQLTMDFLTSLTLAQANLVFETLIDADGHRKPSTLSDGTVSHTVTFTQQDEERCNGFQSLAALLGKRTNARFNHHSGCWNITVYKHDSTWMHCVDSGEEHYRGIVWCPSVATKTFMARRNGTVYWTGNTEILTDEWIEEYINDELIRQTPNPLGVIPIVHIPNLKAGSSPWGLADCHNITSLNREYNEVATQIADIINYHAAPITVVTGAKSNQLEVSPKKVWAITQPGADIKNLEMSGDLAGPLSYLESVKRSMHEMVGVPETALGQVQPISNTSGVALSMQFQPLMQKWHQKVNQYGKGLERINELALLTLFLKEPELLAWDEDVDPPLKDEQLPLLDPEDPLTYETYAHFPAPLPIDQLIALNEIQMKMSLGLESREGALKQLGEEFPYEKLEEIRQELMEDAKADGALQLLKTSIQKEIFDLTGMMPSPDGAEMPPMMDGPLDATGEPGNPVPQTPQPAVDPASVLEQGAEYNIRNDLVTRAYGTKLPSRKPPTEAPDGAEF